MKKEEKKNTRDLHKGFSENQVRISEYPFMRHFRLATSDA